MASKALAELDQATIALAKELFSVKTSLDVYSLVGLNASRIQSGKIVFGHIQNLCLLHVTLGLAKIFEREKPPYELCSIPGIRKLSTRVPMRNSSALRAYLKSYGVESSDDWVQDVAAAHKKQRPLFNRHLRRVTRARNTSIAHLQRNVSPQRLILPSVATFQELLSFGVGFYGFINDALLGASAHPILADRKVANDLARLLEKTGVDNVIRDFPD